MKRASQYAYLAMALAASSGYATEISIGNSCEASGTPIIGFGLVCSWVNVTNNSIVGAPLTNRTFLDDLIAVGGSGTNTSISPGIISSGSGTALARTSFGYNGTQTNSTSTYFNGQVSFNVITQAKSIWY